MPKKPTQLEQIGDGFMGVLTSKITNNSDIAIEIQSFRFGASEIRIVFIDGIIWFVANDVCLSIGIKNPRDSVKLLDPEDVGTTDILTPGGFQQMNIINESGLYNLIFQSRKPEAQSFKKWVTSEVLPSIRETGKYEIQNVKELSEDERRILIRDQIKNHNPKLSEEAQKAGVGITGDPKKDCLEFAIFHNKGYQGLYGGLGKKQIARKKGVSEKKNILDFMNSTELAANFFRVTQTEEKLKNSNITDRNEAYNAHYIVGKQVREAMISIGGVKPEEIPFEEDIKKIEKKKKKDKRQIDSKNEEPESKIEIDISTQLWSVALLIASTKPAGIITTKELHEEIPKYIVIPEKYKEYSEAKQEPKINQVIRNLKSNKNNKTSIFSRGFATEIRGGFQITKEGLDFVKEAFKNFV